MFSLLSVRLCARSPIGLNGRNAEKCMADFAPGAPLKHYVFTFVCTLLGRRVCKRVDVYIITLSCTWRTYAVSERLLVIKGKTT